MAATTHDRLTCEATRELLDVRAPSERRHESRLAVHLAECADCARRAADLERLRQRLKAAIDADAPPKNLEAHVSAAVRASASLTRRWLAAAAAVVLALGGGMAAVYVGRDAANPSNSANSRLIAELLPLGLHVHADCERSRSAPEQPVSLETMQEQVGVEYAGLPLAVGRTLPEGYLLVDAHRCSASGREVLHLVLGGTEGRTSLVVAREDGLTAHTELEIANLEAGAFHASGFTATSHLVCVVSESPGTRRMAGEIAPVMRNYLTSHPVYGHTGRWMG